AQAAWRACLFRRNSWRIGCWLRGRRQKISWTWSFTLNPRCTGNILTMSRKCQRNEILYRQRAGAKNVMVVMKSKIFDALGVGVGLTLASIFTSAKDVVKNLNRSQAIVACSALTVLCGAR